MSGVEGMVRIVTVETLYGSLAQRAAVDADADPARTERTADDRETIDRDRVQSDLYSQLSRGIPPGQGDTGRTEITRADAETVDRDRQAPHGFSSLFGAGEDLYSVLATSAPASAGDRGRTALTESTESIDWDRPPIGPWT
jgi:hypothetical protein